MDSDGKMYAQIKPPTPSTASMQKYMWQIYTHDKYLKDNSSTGTTGHFWLRKWEAQNYMLGAPPDRLAVYNTGWNDSWGSTVAWYSGVRFKRE
jgi:hypothetical protein